jgi:hypothetical protein
VRGLVPWTTALERPINVERWAEVSGSSRWVRA